MEQLFAPENLNNLIGQLGTTTVAVLVMIFVLKKMFPGQTEMGKLIQGLDDIKTEIHGLRADMKTIGTEVTENCERIVRVETKVG